MGEHVAVNFVAHLKFSKFKVALNPLDRILFKLCKKLYHTYHTSKWVTKLICEL